MEVLEVTGLIDSICDTTGWGVSALRPVLFLWFIFLSYFFYLLPTAMTAAVLMPTEVKPTAIAMLFFTAHERNTEFVPTVFVTSGYSRKLTPL